MANSQPPGPALSSSAGVLYVVATPIGNLADITARARQVLSAVAVIAAEDTRRARQLLAPLPGNTRLVAYHDFSKHRQAAKLMALLQAGESIALIADAGTPLIADPGFKLVRLARENRIRVVPVPGPSAVTAALSVSGIATDRFVFEGFLPPGDSARRKRLTALATETGTLVCYESPHRIVATVAAMAECLGGTRRIFLAREMTKKFEQHFFGTVAECEQWLQQDPNRQRGEFSLVLAGASAAQTRARGLAEGMELVWKLRQDLSLKRAVALAAELSGASRSELYGQALAEQQSSAAQGQPNP